MAITKNRTYSSDGGYAASNKQKEYVPKSVAKKASLMLREQERQRLIEAAKRLDAQTRGTAAPCARSPRGTCRCAPAGW